MKKVKLITKYLRDVVTTIKAMIAAMRRIKTVPAQMKKPNRREERFLN